MSLHTKTKKPEQYIRNRIASLKKNPVENARLIKKWERELRKLENTI